MTCPTCNSSTEDDATRCAMCGTEFLLAPVVLTRPASGAYPPRAAATGWYWWALAGALVVLAGSVVVAAKLLATRAPEPVAPVSVATAPPTVVATAPTEYDQVVAVNTLLSSSGESKADLGSALDSVCRSPGSALAVIEGVEQSRASQLARAQQLSFDAIENGAAVRGALIEALAHSLNADRAFAAWAQRVRSYGCQYDDNYTNGQRSSDLAQKAKRTFVGLWNPIAARYGMPSRQPQSI